MGRCVRDCAQDRDCPSGTRCNANGLCEGPDTGVVDDHPKEPVDLGFTPADQGQSLPVDSGNPAHDAGFDLGFDQGFDAGFDSGQGPLDAGFDSGNTARDAGFDLGFDQGVDSGNGPRDTGPVDTGLATPVAVGVYDFTAIRPDALLSPVAVAWHPSGAYALIVTAQSSVWRFDASAQAVSLVTMTSNDVAWRGLDFAPDGASALLVATTTSGSGSTATRRGRLFVWQHAGQSLSEITAAAATGGGFESVRFDPSGARAAVLFQGTSSTVIRFVDARGAPAGNPIGRGMAGSTGCNDVEWTLDGFGDPALAVVCGQNTGEIAQVTNLSGTPSFVTAPSGGQGNVGNTIRVARRLDGALALAVSASSNKLYRYQSGQWETGFESPFSRAAFGVTFSDDGNRALLFGGYGYLSEFRYNLYSSSAITAFQIGLGAPPFNQPSQSSIADVAFRPRCDEGLVVGGVNNLTARSTFVAYFRVANGRRCSTQ